MATMLFTITNITLVLLYQFSELLKSYKINLHQEHNENDYGKGVEFGSK